MKEMWDRDDCEPVRAHMSYNARIAVIEGRSENIYPDIPDDDDDVDGLIGVVCGRGRNPTLGCETLKFQRADGRSPTNEDL